MIDHDDSSILPLLIPIVIICGIFFIGVDYVSEDYKSKILTSGDKVRTSDYYNECFNESFEGRVISSTLYRYTVRDMEGNERTFEKKWLVKECGSKDLHPKIGDD